MTDEKIIQLYFNRDEKAIEETSIKYGSYCYKIANNILRNRQDSEELEECLAGHSDVEALYIVEELQETINTFVRALPEREGNVFIRRYFYSDSIKDISVRYRMSENNIRVMLNRTRNKLRDRLEKEGYLS